MCKCNFPMSNFDFFFLDIEDELELPLFFYSRMNDHAPGPFRSFYMLLEVL